MIKKLIDAFENDLRKGVIPKNIITVSISHGTLINELINNIKSYTNRNVEVLSSGREIQNLLTISNIPHTKVIGEVFKFTNRGEEVDVLQEYKFSSEDILVVCSINTLPYSIIDLLMRQHHGLLILIGDQYNADYLNAGKTIELLSKADVIINDNNRNIGYSQEMIFLANRIKNGVLKELVNLNHRSYAFIKKANLNSKEILERISESTQAITNKRLVPQYTRSLRELLGFELPIPVIGEKIIFFDYYRILDPRNTDPYNCKYIDINKCDRAVVCDVDTSTLELGFINTEVELEDGVHVTLPLSVKFLYNMYNMDDIYPNVGVKAFFTYVISPDMIDGAAWDKVTFIYESIYSSNKRVLYTIAQSAKKYIEIIYDDNYIY